MVLGENGEDKMVREQVPDLINNILRRKANWIGHILRRICLLHGVIEGQMTEGKEVGRTKTQLLDDLSNRILGANGGS